MSTETVSWAYEQELPAVRRFVLVTLAHHADSAGQNCYPGQALIAEETGLVERTVGRHLAGLEAAGVVARQQRYGADGKPRGNDVWILLGYPEWVEARRAERRARRAAAREKLPDSVSGSPQKLPDNDDEATRQSGGGLPDNDDHAPYMNKTEQDRTRRARDGSPGGGPADARAEDEPPELCPTLIAQWRSALKALRPRVAEKALKDLSILVPIDRGDAYFELAHYNAAYCQYVRQMYLGTIAEALDVAEARITVKHWVREHWHRERARGAAAP